jgi:agmatine deiminase
MLQNELTVLNGGVRMPGEFEAHAACLMAWPGNAAAWDGCVLADVQKNYVALAKAIRQFEPVTFIVDPSAEKDARQKLGSDIEVIVLPATEAWFRDSGPSFVKQKNGELAGVSWRFNGWGGYSPDYVADTMVARKLLRSLEIPLISSALAMEGGALHVDGQGTLLTTESVVFADNRNPGITREAAEAEFARTLGIQKTIWLPGSHLEAGTNGHIDGIACFVEPGVILFETSASSRPEYRAVTEKNLLALQGQTDAQGRTIELVYVQEAPDLRWIEGQKWGYSTSYVNLYLANGAVIMPSFGIPEDAAGFASVCAAFPGRTVVQVDISVLAAGGGGIHCVTQQIPL